MNDEINQLDQQGEVLIDEVDAREFSTFFNFLHSHLESEQGTSPWMDYNRFIGFCHMLSSTGAHFNYTRLYVVANGLEDDRTTFNADEFRELLHVGNMYFMRMCKMYEQKNDVEKYDWWKSKILTNYKLYSFLNSYIETNSEGIKDKLVAIEYR